MRRKKLSGFTLSELLVSMLILTIVGGACVSAFSIMFRLFLRIEDRSVADTETDWAFSRIDKTMAYTGLGLPPRSLDIVFREEYDNAGDKTNRDRYCSYTPTRPIMADMTYGPVLISQDGVQNTDLHCYEGSELYYTWSEPTGALLDPNYYDNYGENPTPLITYARRPGDFVSENSRRTNYQGDNFNKLSALQNDFGIWCNIASFRLKAATGTSDIKDLGEIKDKAGNNLITGSCWIAFPSFGVPCWYRYFYDGNAIRYLTYVAIGALGHAENSSKPVNPELMGGILSGYEEVHIVRGAKIALESNTLVHELYRYYRDETGGKDEADIPRPLSMDIKSETLAQNIAGLWFQFYPDTRVVKMFVAMQGREPRITTGRPSGWPERAVPAFDNENRNIIVRSKTWQLQN